jgi:hypothetical protein
MGFRQGPSSGAVLDNFDGIALRPQRPRHEVRQLLLILDE